MFTRETLFPTIFYGNGNRAIGVSFKCSMLCALKTIVIVSEQQVTDTTYWKKALSVVYLHLEDSNFWL